MYQKLFFFVILCSLTTVLRAVDSRTLLLYIPALRLKELTAYWQRKAFFIYNTLSAVFGSLICGRENTRDKLRKK